MSSIIKNCVDCVGDNTTNAKTCFKCTVQRRVQKFRKPKISSKPEARRKIHLEKVPIPEVVQNRLKPVTPVFVENPVVNKNMRNIHVCATDGPRKNLNKLTLTELRRLCRNESIGGYSKLQKGELLEHIELSREKVQCPKCGKRWHRHHLASHLRESRHPFRFQRELFAVSKSPREQKTKCKECEGYFGPGHFHLENEWFPTRVSDLKFLEELMGIARNSRLRKAELLDRIREHIFHRNLLSLPRIEELSAPRPERALKKSPFLVRRFPLHLTRRTLETIPV